MTEETIETYLNHALRENSLFFSIFGEKKIVKWVSSLLNPEKELGKRLREIEILEERTEKMPNERAERKIKELKETCKETSEMIEEMTSYYRKLIRIKEKYDSIDTRGKEDGNENDEKRTTTKRKGTLLQKIHKKMQREQGRMRTTI